MKKRIRYGDEPMDLRVVPDFLPPPEELRLKQSRVKVTLEVSRESLDFYKAQSGRDPEGHLRMMQQLLDIYASRHSEADKE
jgi:hypothetical protein